MLVLKKYSSFKKQRISLSKKVYLKKFQGFKTILNNWKLFSWLVKSNCYYCISQCRNTALWRASYRLSVPRRTSCTCASAVSCPSIRRTCRCRRSNRSTRAAPPLGRCYSPTAAPLLWCCRSTGRFSRRKTPQGSRVLFVPLWLAGSK